MTGTCASCRFFRAEPRAIEAAVPGLTTMGSGYASVRASDGLCDCHGRYVSATSHCGHHDPALPDQGAVAPSISSNSVATLA